MRRDEILDAVCTKDCPHFRQYEDTRYEQGEMRCFDGNFGDDYPCEAIIGEVERVLESGDLSDKYGYVDTAEACAKIAREEGVDYGVDWESHPYWIVYYDERKPSGLDSIEQVWGECFG